MTLSLRCHGAHSARTVLLLHSHCVVSVKTPGMTTALHNDPCVRPRSSVNVVADLTTWLSRPYGDPIVL